MGESGVRMKHTFFEYFPCIKENIQIKALVDEVLESQNITELSQKIDHKIYELYGLNHAEIKCIEAK